ncbi:hypothetical protein N7474_009823 [Penicillium riverlandense]|uniref:uncharacterized protein n=1 Tax=Penicillium riverlandense TaxID=1903569 RepID=UPI00254847C3|nr:uncharacterized protein N7474_009823 [Penicillium riverlandense]KAJ5808554.1 hypothetical protein N7474_009823 [Penicillium riverlandense]
MPRTARQSCLAQQQPAIQAFTRATKAGASQLPTTKKSASFASLPVSPSKKRKLQELENVESASPQQTAEENLTPSKALKLNQLSVSSPRSGHYASPKRTPSRRARASNANVQETTPSKQRTLNFEKIKAEPAIIPRPACFTEILDLHSCFVQALSLHAAHNGSNNPADLRQFLPSVTRIWRKRKVQQKDLQRLVWIWDQSTKSSNVSYRLANYGLGKIYGGTAPALQESFEQALDLLWEKAQEAFDGASDEDRASLFIETLGLSPVHESLIPFASFHKGQQRLQDLKGGIIRMKTEKLRAESEQCSPKTLAATTNRRQGLLDRIKNKQLHQSTLPPPPTKREVIRRAAADRVEEVAGILALLRPAGYVGTGIKAMLAAQRKPFKLEMIVQHVQDSIRSPIASEEVVMCIEILAEAGVAGQWVSIVPINEMRSVVLKSCSDVSAKDIGAKVAKLKAEWDAPCGQNALLAPV